MTKTFPRVGWLHFGYDPRKVDEFFAQAKQKYDAASADDVTSVDTTSVDGIDDDVRAVSFTWVRNGYRAQVVDAALDRLEQAYVHRRRAIQVRTGGEEEWLRLVYERATSLYPRLRRPAGRRFAHPEKFGYAVKDVDALMARIIAFFNDGTPLAAREVRGASFARARGNRAYAEGVVDAYLDRVVSVLLSVE